MDESIKSTIGRLIQNAQDNDAADKRGKLFDRYMGEPYGDEQSGRSAFVSTDVADAVEAILPEILEPFTAAEDIIEFAPVGPEDEQAARQETAVVSHIFWQKNRGFENLYVWVKEALMQQNSYIKRGWEDKERVEIEEYADLSFDELAVILQDRDDYEVLEAEHYDPETGMPEFDDMGQIKPISIKLRCVSKEQRYVIEAIPQEEFFHTPRWGRVSLEGIPCCGHKREVEAGDLRAMGFHEDSIAEATEESGDGDRFDTADLYEGSAEDGDDATRKVTVYEAYCRIDINGDGMAELVRVWATGDGSTVLKWADGRDAIDEVSSLPFSALTPYIVPHRHVGRSVAELVDDIQRVKTVLMRHTLDNLYLTNYARPVFDEGMAGANLFNDLANPAPGAPIRTGGAMIEWQMPPSVVGTTLPLMQQMDELKEARTGATRYNQGLDAESLNKTATGINRIMEASLKRIALIARTIAETGLRDLFLGIHRDLRAGPMKELAMKLTGQWVQVNPRLWKDRTDMVVKVGMGSGDREQRRAALMLMAQMQRELMAGGSRMVDESKIRATASQIMATFGFKSIDPFLHDPATLPPAPPPGPDPQMQMAQAQLQIVQREADARIRLDAQKAQWAHEERMMQLQLQAKAEQTKELATAAKINSDGERLDIDRAKVKLDDDFRRDQLATRTAPPMSYDEF